MAHSVAVTVRRVVPAKRQVLASGRARLRSDTQRRIDHSRQRYVTARASEKAQVGPQPPQEAGEDSSPPKEDGDGAAEPEAEEPEKQADPLEKLTAAIQDSDAETAVESARSIIGDLQTEVAEAQSKATHSDEQLRQLKDQYRRLQADFDNFRSRSEADKQRAGSSARMHLLEDLLPLIDNFEMAGKAVKTTTDGEEKIHNSYQNLYRQMVDIFRGLGLEAVATTGTQFDPEMHDGVMREDNDDVADGEVLEEFRKGFKYKDQLLRPAMVKVASSNKPSPDAKPKGPEDIPTDSDLSGAE